LRNNRCFENENKTIGGNGLGLCAVWDFKAQKFSLAQMFNRNPNVQFSTSAQIAQNPCYKLAAVN
jgi:hypothetical protein